MKIVKIYDPAMCCSTGVCGTDVDPKLVQLANFLESLDKSMFQVKRYNLANEPAQYAQNSEVAKILKEEGVDALPLFFVDDELKFSKEYPSISELSSALGVGSFFVKL